MGERMGENESGRVIDQIDLFNRPNKTHFTFQILDYSLVFSSTISLPPPPSLPLFRVGFYFLSLSSRQKKGFLGKKP